MISLLLEILAFLLMAAPTAVEVLVDRREIKYRGKDRRKGNDVIWRCAMMLVAGFFQSLFTDKTWWQGAILSGGIFIMTFDYCMALVMSERLTYLGKTSHTDRFLRNFPWFAVLFFRGILFASAATVYYDLHKVIYGNF